MKLMAFNTSKAGSIDSLDMQPHEVHRRSLVAKNHVACDILRCLTHLMPPAVFPHILKIPLSYVVCRQCDLASA